MDDTRLVYHRVWRAAHRDSVNASGKRYRATHPGVSTAQWLKWMEKRAGRPRPVICEVCSGPPDSRGLHFDHDHATGEFRGWICHGCNAALGHVKDDIDRLEALIVYLARSRRPKLKVAQ